MSATGSKKARKGRPKPGQLLSSVPYPNEAMERTDKKDGTVLLSVPMRKPRWLIPPLSWVLPYSTRRRVELDDTGTWVLNQCDGKNTVEAIIEKFAKNNKLSFRESQVPVTQFLEQMSQRGLIAIVGFDTKADS